MIIDLSAETVLMEILVPLNLIKFLVQMFEYGTVIEIGMEYFCELC